MNRIRSRRGPGWGHGAAVVSARLLGTLFALLVVAGTVPVLAQPPSSSSFVLSQSTVNNGGASAVSPSYVLDGSAAQESVVGEAGSTSFVLQSGFWTSLSTLNVLRVAAAGSGEASVGGDGIACSLGGGTVSGDCSEPVTYGTEVELVASPLPANRFDGWSGCDALLTTNLPDDTCRVDLKSSRTVTAAMTLLGTVGDRVWLDLDGDGLEELGEPGVDGVEVTLDGGGISRTATTAGGGLYDFTDLPPGPYTVSVDPATLPVGVFPTFDADGAATAHDAALTLVDGQDLDGADFGYQPLADLAVSKEASDPSLPASGVLVYTITVQNLGPAEATGVVVTDVLPAGLTPVQTVGCVEDPAGVPTCTLGTLGPGESAAYTVEVTADPVDQPAFSNIATAASEVVDPNPGNDAGSVATQPTPILEIPALGPGGLALLALLLALLGGRMLGRRGRRRGTRPATG